MGSCILNYTRNQFCGGRKPECPEETLEVRLRSTETRSTYNFVVEVEGVIDVHYASLTSQGVQHRAFYRDGHPSRYQPRPTGLNFGEQTGTGVFPSVIAVPSSVEAWWCRGWGLVLPINWFRYNKLAFVSLFHIEYSLILARYNRARGSL